MWTMTIDRIMYSVSGWDSGRQVQIECCRETTFRRTKSHRSCNARKLVVKGDLKNAPRDRRRVLGIKSRL